MKDNYNVLLKILLIGDSGAGKSCLLMRFSDDKFHEKRLCTIGIDFKIKSITVDDVRVKLQIWDTAGQERFRTITQAYYRSVMGILIVYDVNNPASFESAHHWLEQIEMHASPKINKILVGNKTDLPSLVSQTEVQRIAEEYGIPHIETSAKDGSGVQEAFHMLARDIIARLEAQNEEETGNEMGADLFEKPKDNGCC